MLFSGDRRDAVGNLSGDGGRQALKRSIHAGAPVASSDLQVVEAGSRQLVGVAVDFNRAGGCSVVLKEVFEVGAFEVDENSLIGHFDGADGAFVDEDARSQLVQVNGERCIDGVGIAVLVGARQSKLDVAIVGNDQTGDFDVTVVENTHTANLRTRDAEIGGDIYKG